MTTDSSKRSLVGIENMQRYLFFNNSQYLNLSSNDYLALSDISLQQEFIAECNFSSRFLLSNPSSRLMTGNSLEYQNLETSLASLFQKESALVLSCGFMVNSSLLGAICSQRDLVIADKLVHASIIDGLKLAGCDFLRFKHNDIGHLTSLLEQKRGQYDNVYLVTESVFSMDGDCAPISELVRLKKLYDLKLYIDEAHAFGVFGDRGCGLCEAEGFLGEIDIIVVTLGKALASQGGVVLSSGEVRDRLINSMRSLIFSTAIPDISLMWSNFLVGRLPQMGDKRAYLAQISAMVREKLQISTSQSHIIPYIVGGNEETVALQKELQRQGFWTTAIRHPTVPKGSERLRISLNSGLEIGELNNFIDIISSI